MVPVAPGPVLFFDMHASLGSDKGCFPSDACRSTGTRSCMMQVRSFALRRDGRLLQASGSADGTIRRTGTELFALAVEDEGSYRCVCPASVRFFASGLCVDTSGSHGQSHVGSMAAILGRPSGCRLPACRASGGADAKYQVHGEVPRRGPFRPPVNQLPARWCRRGYGSLCVSWLISPLQESMGSCRQGMANGDGRTRCPRALLKCAVLRAQPVCVRVVVPLLEVRGALHADWAVL